MMAMLQGFVAHLRALLRPSARRRMPREPDRMRVEALEARILHSADLGPGLLGMPAAVMQVEHRELDAGGEFADAAARDTQHEVRGMAFVDAATPYYQAIVDDLRSNGEHLEVVVIDGNRDGITQISEALAGRKDLQAVHIISHGGDGVLHLGDGRLGTGDLAAYADEIAGWSRALAADADILLYGCDVAATANGRTLVAGLARLTGADVAASDDRTGAVAAGGDWDLEYAAGSIETRIAVSSGLQAQWAGVLANTSPTLAGAENLATITEDATANPGTRVSDLVAGHTSDPDAGALTGIAVTGVDNTNGTWQFSTNGGGSWTDFGAPSATGARLLAADAGTYVRFVPHADWHGTVNNGLTFRAWDQTSGAAGGIADTTTTTSTVRDEFTTAGYANNNGTASWSSNWVDNDGDASGGAVQIAGGRLQISTLLAGSGSIHRQADLAGATSATLSFSYDNQILIGLGGNVELRISDDGGASYSSLVTFSSGNSGTGIFSTSITGFISGATRIQFVSSGIAVAQSLFVDDLQISYVTPLASGVTAFSAATASSGITVSPVNDAPAGADRTVTILEDTPYVLTAADFGYSDAHDNPANNFIAVTMTSLPAGSLTLNGAAVIAGQSISIGDILAGDLVFVPPGDAAGTAVASFTFQVQDDGGGADLDPIANTLTFDATPVNDPPAGTDTTVTIAEDGTYTFSAADFGFNDPDVPADNFVAVTLTTLPGNGTLLLNGSAVAAGQSISVGLLGTGALYFVPAVGASGPAYASFTFQVESSGGAANTDPTPNSITVNVTSVNDPPVATSGSVATDEDTPYAFTVADFGFTDPDDSPANALLAVRVASLPAAGSLTLNGAAVLAGQFVSATDIAAGLLEFTAAPDANGSGYTSFLFQVQDDGGGGADLSLATRTMSIDVVAVNDAPVLTNNNGVTVAEASSAGIDAGMLHVSDADTALSQLVYSIGVATVHGRLELTTAPGVAIASFSQDDIANNRLVYVHDGSQTTSDTFSFTVSDGVGASVGSTMFSITISGVNDAPSGALPGGQATPSGSPLVFSSANGNAIAVGDVDAGAGLIEVSLVATHGTLSLAGTAGLTFITGSGSGDVSMAFRGTLADLNAALDGLAFAPDAGFTGAASLAFFADDLGNTGSGGALTVTGTVAISVLALPDPASTFDPGPAILDPVVPPVIAHPPLPFEPGTAPVDSGTPEAQPAEDAAAGAEIDPDQTTDGDFEGRADAPAGSGRIPIRADGSNSISNSSHSGRGSNVAYGGADIRYLLGTQDQPETTLANFALSPDASASLASQASASLQSQSLLDSLDRLRDGLQDESRIEFNSMALTTAASLGLSVGYVLWLLRGGVLVSSVLSSLPAWRFVDPLPILGRLEEEDDEPGDPDESLESMVARNNRAAAEAQPA